MKKGLLKFVCTSLVAMLCMSVNAQDTSGSCGDNATWSYEGTTLTISGTGAMNDYAYGEAPWNAYADVMKSIQINEGITSVGNNAFAGFTALRSVTFPPEGFTSIGEYAFSGCTSFKNLNMPSSMTTIGDGAFSGSAVRGATIYSGVQKIGDYAFESCTSLDGVAIYEGVKEIGEGAFDGCAFTSVVIPSTVTTIGEGAFMSNTALESVYIGAGVTNIGAAAFQGCTALTSVGLGGATAPTLGDAVFTDYDGETPLAIDAFYVPSTTPYSGGWGGYAAAKFKTVYEAAWENSNDPAEGSGTWSFNVTTGALTVNGTGNLNVSPWMGLSAINPELYDNEHPGYWSKVLSFVVGEGITHIQTMGVGMQINCASVTLPSTLKYIGYSCLEECAFTSIELPEGLETIDDYTFFDSKLTSLTIPSTVTHIGSSAFLANEDLTTITCLPVTPPNLGEYEPCFGDGSTITAIYVPAGSVDAYKNWEWDESIGYTGWDGWKAYADKIQPIADAPATTTTFAYTATEKETRFDTFAKFTGATAVKSHEFADGAGTVVYEGTVTEIQGDAFRAAGGSNTNLTSITIPESVTSLAANALRKSTALTTVNFAGTPTLTTIGTYVFASCSALANITLPASVTTIGGQAFSDCTALTTFDVPEGVTSIGGQAFGGCSNLTAINFTGTPTLTSIGGSAFYNCKKLTTLTLPESLTTIGNDVFNGAGITSIFIPKNVSNVGEGLSYGCEIATLTVDPDNATYDSRNDCNAVIEKATNKLVAGCRNTVIPDGIVTLGTFAFAQFKGTFSLTIPESVTSFEFGAIHMCPGLTTVNIPSGITSMDDMLFGGCNCTDVYCYIEDPATLTWAEGGAMAFANNKATKFYVKDGTLAAWQAKFPDANVTFVEGLPTPATTTFTYLATEKVTAFDEYANFTGATALASHDFADGAGTVVYNGTVTALESGAFYYNNTKEALTAITLPESLTALGDDAFRSCTGLTTVTFDGTPALTTINKRVFQGCSALATIAIPASVETIGSGAFSGCSGLASVTFPGTSALTTIGTTAFSNCKSLATITLPESVTTIGEVQIHGENTYYNGSVFSGAGLTSFVLPKKLTTIYGGGHFRNCPITSLTVDTDNAKYEDRGSNAIIEKETDKLVLGCVTTTVPDGIKVIGNEAFFGEEQEFALTLPESVTTIEARAFHYATGLTVINIPSNVTDIPDETFAQCNLTTLIIPDGVTSIGGMAFMMCMNLKTITFGSGLTSIGAWAFECPNVTDIYCYADPFTTWDGNGFANAKATKFHVADADAWSTKFPDANVTFVGDLVDVTLAEDVDNTAAIAARNGHKANVTLTRTLQAASWNTFAVPFDVDATTLKAKGITAKKLSASTLDGTTLTLTFADATSIEAGKPYLVKVTSDVENPTFEDVTVSSTTTPTTTEYVDLVPTTGKTLVTGPAGSEDEETSVLILGAENKLSNPTVVNDAENAASYIKGFRAYFQLRDGAALARTINIDLGNGETTDIHEMNHVQIQSIYDLSGRQIVKGNLSKGVYVVKGRKVVVR